MHIYAPDSRLSARRGRRVAPRSHGRRVHTYACARVGVCMYVSIPMCVRMGGCMHVRAHTYAYVRVGGWVHVRVGGWVGG